MEWVCRYVELMVSKYDLGDMCSAISRSLHRGGSAWTTVPLRSFTALGDDFRTVMFDLALIRSIPVGTEGS